MGRSQGGSHFRVALAGRFQVQLGLPGLFPALENLVDVGVGDGCACGCQDLVLQALRDRSLCTPCAVLCVQVHLRGRRHRAPVRLHGRVLSLIERLARRDDCLLELPNIALLLRLQQRLFASQCPDVGLELLGLVHDHLWVHEQVLGCEGGRQQVSPVVRLHEDGVHALGSVDAAHFRGPQPGFGLLLEFSRSRDIDIRQSLLDAVVVATHDQRVPVALDVALLGQADDRKVTEVVLLGLLVALGDRLGQHVRLLGVPLGAVQVVLLQKQLVQFHQRHGDVGCRDVGGALVLAVPVWRRRSQRGGSALHSLAGTAGVLDLVLDHLGADFHVSQQPRPNLLL